MKATIRLIDDELVAICEDNREFKHLDAAGLADLLWAHGVSAEDVQAVDWHTHAENSPMSGHKIAIFSRLRQLMIASYQSDMQAARDRTIRKLLNLPIWVSREELSLSLSEQGKKADHIDLWLRRGKLFAVEHDDVQIFAKFQFDGEYHPRPVIEKILQLLKSKDDWAIASWFAFPNGWLSPHREEASGALPPMSCLDDEEAVLRAARNELETYCA